MKAELASQIFVGDALNQLSVPSKVCTKPLAVFLVCGSSSRTAHQFQAGRSCEEDLEHGELNQPIYLPQKLALEPM
jgi:hypothetical protein